MFNITGKSKYTVIILRGITVSSSLSIFWKGVLLFRSYLNRERCIGGGIIEARVRLEKGAQGRFKTGVGSSIGPVHLKLQPEWQGVSMYIPISLFEKWFFSFPLSQFAMGVVPAEQ